MQVAMIFCTVRFSLQQGSLPTYTQFLPDKLVGAVVALLRAVRARLRAYANTFLMKKGLFFDISYCFHSKNQSQNAEVAFPPSHDNFSPYQEERSAANRIRKASR